MFPAQLTQPGFLSLIIGTIFFGSLTSSSIEKLRTVSIFGDAVMLMIGTIF
jgi:hypothetical protein